MEAIPIICRLDGSPMKDRLAYHPDGEHVIYFDQNGHEVFTNFQYCDSVQYICYFAQPGIFIQRPDYICW